MGHERPFDLSCLISAERRSMGESAVLVGKFSLIRHQAQRRYRRLFNDYFPTTRPFFWGISPQNRTPGIFFWLIFVASHEWYYRLTLLLDWKEIRNPAPNNICCVSKKIVVLWKKIHVTSTNSINKLEYGCER